VGRGAGTEKIKFKRKRMGKKIKKNKTLKLKG
jgi:hypothetical protein